ncbi:MAG TPA: TIGR03618 family F420-dependent PPOX class oxidoreductase [Microbacteriaceae bacterium]
MAELTDEVRTWLKTRHQAVLITLRANGAPQSSNVGTTFDGTDFHVSVTASRAKTRNLLRDPRATMHVLGRNFWSFASVSCTADVGAVSTAPGDQPGQALLALYNTISDVPHPNPAEFFQAMVDERRLVLTLHPLSVAGNGWQAR